MRLEIHDRGIGISEALRDHILRRFHSALGRFRPRIDAVSVTLEDLNGPRGGRDTRCRVLVTLRPRGRFIVAVTDLDPLVAVDRAADRAGHRMSRDSRRRRRRRDLSMSGEPTRSARNAWRGRRPSGVPDTLLN